MPDTKTPSLSKFTAQLRSRNISRPNQYYIEIIPPPIFRSSRAGFYATDIELVSAWCHSAQTPQVSIETDDSYLEAGTRRKFAYNQDYANLTLGFYLDQNYKIKRFFDQWKQAIVPQRRNFGYPKDYTSSSLKVYIIDQTGNATYSYDYVNIYPKTLASVDLNYTATGAISNFSVEFVFEDVYYSEIMDDQVLITSKPKSVTLVDNSGGGITNPELKQSLSPIISGGGGATGSF